MPVYELFEEGGDLYYTMRPIEGVTLEEVLSNLRDDRAGDEWPMGRLVRLFLQSAPGTRAELRSAATRRGAHRVVLGRR